MESVEKLPKSVLIISTEIGDEFIGCSYIFRNRNLWDTVDIFYLTDIEDRRFKEAENFTRTFNCDLYYYYSDPEINFDKYQYIFIPNCTGESDLHRSTYSIYIDKATNLYSVNNRIGNKLIEEEQEWKRRSLYYFYPSLKETLDSNPEYWQYENVLSVQDKFINCSYGSCVVNVKINNRLHKATIYVQQDVIRRVCKDNFSSIKELWIYLSSLTFSKFTINVAGQIIEGNS